MLCLITQHDVEQILIQVPALCGLNESVFPSHSSASFPLNIPLKTCLLFSPPPTPPTQTAPSPITRCGSCVLWTGQIVPIDRLLKQGAWMKAEINKSVSGARPGRQHWEAPMAGGQLPLLMPNISALPWHRNGHLLHCSCQAHRIHTNICLPREEREQEHDGPQREREREHVCD